MDHCCSRSLEGALLLKLSLQVWPGVILQTSLASLTICDISASGRLAAKWLNRRDSCQVIWRILHVLLCMMFSAPQPLFCCLQELYRNMSEAQRRVNKSQAQSILTSIKRRCSLWQGPPGTGKTVTLVRLLQVRLLCAANLHRRPLFCKPPAVQHASLQSGAR